LPAVSKDAAPSRRARGHGSRRAGVARALTMRRKESKSLCRDTKWMRSAASAGSRSNWPSAKRYSIATSLLSMYPLAARPWHNAASLRRGRQSHRHREAHHVLSSGSLLMPATRIRRRRTGDSSINQQTRACSMALHVDRRALAPTVVGAMVVQPALAVACDRVAERPATAAIAAGRCVGIAWIVCVA
jgi:hypothetical protein